MVAAEHAVMGWGKRTSPTYGVKLLPVHTVRGNEKDTVRVIVLQPQPELSGIEVWLIPGEVT